MSTEHNIPVIRFEASKAVKHANADSLSIYEVDGRPVITRTGSFEDGQLVAYVPVDTLAPTDTEVFAFLKPDRTIDERPFHRVRAARLRGVFSMGLLVPAPAGLSEGDDATEALGTQVYEPDIGRQPGTSMGPRQTAEVPSGVVDVVYDLESLRKIAGKIPNGTRIRVTEKLHGTNIRIAFTPAANTTTFDPGVRLMELHVGSRNLWIKYNPDNAYWKAVIKELGAGDMFVVDGRVVFTAPTDDTAMDGVVLVGELLGVQKGFPYDGSMRVFDGFKDGQRLTDVNASVPPLGEYTWDDDLFDFLQGLANGKSKIDGKTQREGIVVEFLSEIPGLRIAVGDRYKLVGSEYMLKG